MSPLILEPSKHIKRHQMKDLKTVYNGKFTHNRDDIRAWVQEKAAANPNVKRIMAGPGIKGTGIGKAGNEYVYFDNSVDENIAVRINGSGVIISGLGTGEQYPFLNALYGVGFIGTEARAIEPGITQAWSK